MVECYFCGAKAERAVALESWVPEFYRADGECVPEPSCPTCATTRLTKDANEEFGLVDARNRHPEGRSMDLLTQLKNFALEAALKGDDWLAGKLRAVIEEAEAVARPERVEVYVAKRLEAEGLPGGEVKP